LVFTVSFLDVQH